MVTQQVDKPNFKIPQTRLDRFKRSYRKDSGLRVGQAFHQELALEKMVHDKAFCDRLYQADGDRAWALIEVLIDPYN